MSARRRNSRVQAKLRNYVPAIACAFIPVVCYLLARPYAELGVADDWSYIKDAQTLALTGHILYSGGGAPMLGWQLYLGAFFIKLFGFSFTAVRYSTVIEAMATAFLLQRTFMQAGINSRNATLATIAFVVSPLYLSYVYTFMSDISGVLCVLVCLYMCLRALHAESERSVMVWLGVAAFVNAVGGTARQLSWLGLLIMVPCTLWLLRRNRRILVVGCLCWIIAACFVFAETRWFAHQPFTVYESPIPNRGAIFYLTNVGRVVLGGTGDLTLYSLPVLLMFAASLRLRSRVLAAAAAILSIAP